MNKLIISPIINKAWATWWKCTEPAAAHMIESLVHEYFLRILHIKDGSSRAVYEGNSENNFIGYSETYLFYHPLVTCKDVKAGVQVTVTSDFNNHSADISVGGEIFIQGEMAVVSLPGILEKTYTNK